MQAHEHVVRLLFPNQTQVIMSSYDPNQYPGQQPQQPGYQGQQPPAQYGYQGQQQPPAQPGQPLANFDATQAARQAVAKFKAAPVNMMGLVVGGIGVLALIPFSFLPYYSIGSGRYSVSANAWDHWSSLLGVLLLFVGALAVAAAASGMLNSLGKNLALVRLIGAAANSLALLLFILSLFTVDDPYGLVGPHVAFFFMLVLAIAAAGLSWYVWMKTKDEVPAGPAAPGFGFGQQPPVPGYQQPPAPGYQQPPAPGYQQPPAPGYQQPPAPGYQQPPAPGGYQQPPAPPAPGYGPPQG